MPHANYTVSTFSIYSSAGSSLSNSYTLVITPDTGWFVHKEAWGISAPSSSSFGTTFEQGVNGCVLPLEVEKVEFQDSENPYGPNYDPNYTPTPTNTVLVEVFLIPSFNILPSTPTTIIIDIDGKASEVIYQFGTCIREYYGIPICNTANWPLNQLADRTTQHCQSHFTSWPFSMMDNSLPTNNPQYSPNWAYTANNTNNWSSPSGLIQSANAAIIQWSGDVNQYANINLLSRTFFTGPGFVFQTPPIIETVFGINNNLAQDYSITQTPNQINIVATTTNSVSNSVAVDLDDTSGILPGMIVFGGNITSCASNGSCWPYMGVDVRVAMIIGNTVRLSEPQNITAGEVLKFQNYDNSGNVTAKKFDVGYTPTENVYCSFPTDPHEVHYIMDSVPASVIFGSTGSTPYLPKLGIQPEITNVTVKKSNVGSVGSTKSVVITGNTNAVFSLKVTNAAGSTYNFTTKAFTSATTTSGDIAVGPKGIQILKFDMPDVTSDDQYDIVVTPKEGSKLGDDVPKTVNTFEIKQYATKTITFDTTGTGLTIASTLDNTITDDAKKDYSDIKSIYTYTGAIQKSGDDILYINRQPTWSADTDGDFSNTRYLEKTVISVNGTSVTLDGVTNIATGHVVTGVNKKGQPVVIDDVTVSSISGNNVVLSKRQPLINKDDTLRFSVGGHHLTVDEATITGSGTTHLTATVKLLVKKFGISDTTVTFALDNFVTADPRVPDASGECAKGGVLDIDLGALDEDVNVAEKTYSLVSGEGPTKGALSGFEGSGSAFDDRQVRYTHDDGEDVGTTDTFIYKATISSDAGDETAEYGEVVITITD